MFNRPPTWSSCLSGHLLLRFGPGPSRGRERFGIISDRDVTTANRETNSAVHAPAGKPSRSENGCLVRERPISVIDFKPLPALNHHP